MDINGFFNNDNRNISHRGGFRAAYINFCTAASFTWKKTELFSSVDRFVDFFNTWAKFKCFKNILQIIKFTLTIFL